MWYVMPPAAASVWISAMRRTFLDLIVLIVLLGFGSALLLWTSPARHAMLPVDVPSALLSTHDIGSLEQLPDGEYFRWTAAHSLLQITNPGGPLELSISAVSGLTGITPIILHTGMISTSIPIQPDVRIYQILLPPQPRERIMLSIDAPARRVAGRDLGIRFSELDVSGGEAVPLMMILALGLMVCSSYAVLRQHVSRINAATILIIAEILIACLQSSNVWIYGLMTPSLLACGCLCIGSLVLEEWWFVAPPDSMPRRFCFQRQRIVVTMLATALWLAVAIS